MKRQLIAAMVLSLVPLAGTAITAEACTTSCHKRVYAELRIEQPECFRKSGKFRNTRDCRDARHQLKLWLCPPKYNQPPADNAPDPDE